MELFEDAPCSYYGSMDPSIKPTKGVATLMLDEYILRTIEKQKNIYQKELEAMVNSIRHTVENSARILQDEIKQTNDDIDQLRAWMKRMMKENKLIDPPVIPAKDMRDRKKKKVTKENAHSDGDLL